MNTEILERTANFVETESRPTSESPIVEKLPSFSLEGLLLDAQSHIDKMAANGKGSVKRETAIDQVLRMPGRPSIDQSDLLDRQANLHVDPTRARERQYAGVPSFINPQELYHTLASEVPFHQIQRKNRVAFATNPEYRIPAPEKEHNMGLIQQQVTEKIQQGANPLRTYYEAAISLVLQEWALRDHVDYHEIQAENALASTQHPDAMSAARAEHQEALYADRPRRFSGEVMDAFRRRA